MIYALVQSQLIIIKAVCGRFAAVVVGLVHRVFTRIRFGIALLDGAHVVVIALDVGRAAGVFLDMLARVVYAMVIGAHVAVTTLSSGRAAAGHRDELALVSL